MSGQVSSVFNFRVARTAIVSGILVLSNSLPVLNAFAGKANASEVPEGKFKHVLLLSIDGLREADLADPKLQAAFPNLKRLERLGVTYKNAFTSRPSDSFPGTLSYVTGASPKTTGVYYDNEYNRVLVAPGGNAASPKGTEVQYAENLDKDSTLLSGGGNAGVDSIDPKQLPLFCKNQQCRPIYPHSYLKVNTIFEVAKQAGLYTAYSDKHPAYDLVNGPSGKGVDDFYAPEIDASVAIENGKLVDASTAHNPGSLTFASATSSVPLTEAYDDLKVKAILNEIQGKNSRGTASAPVPAIFGMNFQAVSVGEKLPMGGIAPDGTPSAALLDALHHTDASVGKMLDALEDRNLLRSTLVVVMAKHGQAPRIGPGVLVKDDTFTNVLNNAGITVAQATQDDVALIWLNDQSKTAVAKQALLNFVANKATVVSGSSVAGQINTPVTADQVVQQIFAGTQELAEAGFGNPLQDHRTPDIIIRLHPGYVLVGNPAKQTKQAEHGGLSEDDNHVALIVGSKGLSDDVKGSIKTVRVSTKQVAVTTLKALGLNPEDLKGAKAEGTRVLPGLKIHRGDRDD